MKSLRRLLPWVITVACFALVYQRIDAAAHRADSHLVPYLTGIFSRVDWVSWLALMVPYSLIYFAIDSLVLWRVINWFNARVRFVDILPVRASTYILSLLNEQVGKGAMALYLHRREGVPGWQVGSSMLFIMFCEFYYLLGFATLGYALQRDALPAVFGAIPWLAACALAFFALWLAYFRGALLPEVRLRERDILHAFRQASLSQYLWILVLRSPALLVAVVVYTLSLRLFGVDASFGRIFGVLPVIFFGAAVPGPMRSVAITMWVTLIPEREGEMAAFGLVMHNFFIFFNAAFGLVFLRRANRELFGSASPAATT